MMKKFSIPSTIMFLVSIGMSALMSISASTWITLWVALELNLMAISAMMAESSKSRSVEALLNYFLTQTLASLLMLLMIFSFNSIIPSQVCSLFLSFSILVKMGSAPFHMWLPKVLNNSPLFMNALILTWQKLAPMLLSIYILTNWAVIILIILIIMNTMFGVLGGISQTQIRPLLAYSSISHLGWMLSGLTMSSSLTMFYFITYCITSIMLLSPLMMMEKHSTSNFNMMNFMSSKMSWIFSINLLSTGGMPPLIGFIPKWLMIDLLISFSSIATLFILLGSALSLYFYLKMVLASITMSNKSLETKTPSKFLSMLMINSLIPFILMVLLMCNNM